MTHNHDGFIFENSFEEYLAEESELVAFKKVLNYQFERLKKEISSPDSKSLVDQTPI